jgi:hypothetical protein
MRAEIVSVGSELLLGQIVDTNAAFIARQLAALGLDLFQSDVVLRKLMPKLIRSHALDALDPSDARAPKHIRVASRRDAAKAFVVSVASAAQGNASIFSTVGLGETMRVDGGAGAAAALVLDGAVIHLAAFDMGHA